MSDYPGIVLALVAINKRIVSEYNTTSTDFSKVLETILKRIPPNDSKLSYAFERKLYHYICKNGVVYLCVASENFGRRIPFSFLKELKTQFLREFPEAEVDDLSISYDSFQNTIQSIVLHYSNNPSLDPIKKVQGEINQVKDIMIQNIERVLERGDRIDTLVDKTNNLSTAAFAFRKRSTAVKRKMWWRHQKIMFLLLSTICIVFYIFVCSLCGFPGLFLFYILNYFLSHTKLLALYLIDWGKCRA
ncbi:hypothetical protein BB561_001257 [Smittium simulii]|uniref:Synaptobrevin homolog YKT6 n=1 Tax=Smittium simulii TaxID=133385 RepID=A0A2T9YVK8_9FUNG|nr:hypothetical protein BB561_001257 [Smittium simulii]